MSYTTGARRPFRALLIAAAVASLLALPQATPDALAAATRTGQEQYDEWQLLDMINASRRSAGLPSLTMVSTWRETSRDHAEEMAAAGRIFRDDSLTADAQRVSSCWTRLAENDGSGYSATSLHSAFMGSTGPRDNILGDYRYAGIGVEWRDGTMWVTERFMKLGSGCTLPAAARPTFHFMDVSLTGSGDGTVTTSPAGIACGTDCREPFTAGTRVTLTAAAASGSVFRGWSGGGCSGTSTCTLTMDAARKVTALFVAQHLLTVATDGSGTGVVTSIPAGIDCGGDCSQTLDEGTEVTLVATPDSDSAFRGWSGGDCASEDPECTLTIFEATSVVATFVAQHDLEVELLGSGSGTVTSWPEGIDCGAQCVARFDEGTEVTLTAAPDPGSAFRGWGGACSGTGECAVSMYDLELVTATFVALYDLDVYKAGTGGGRITSTPGGIRCGSDCSGTFDDGTDVTLRAEPNRWSRFVRWRGACAGAGATCVVTVDQSLSTTAVFNRRRT